MNNVSAERLNLLFEMESIKSNLTYIAPGVSLKVVANLGYKDQNGNKRRFYEEIRYKSNKYKNTEHLISSNFNVDCYLLLEYPNPKFNNYDDSFKSKGIVIKAYAIDDIVDRMKEFNRHLINCFGVNNDTLYIKSGKIIDVTVYPTLYSTISFRPDIHESNNRREMGVRLTLNNEFSITVSAETVWPELVYRISRCDLTMLGFQMIQSYMSLLPGMAVTEYGEPNRSTNRYAPYWEDPDDIANRPESVKITPRLSDDQKKKSFFDGF